MTTTAPRFGRAFRLEPRKRYPVPLLHPRRWRWLRPALALTAAGVGLGLIVYEAVRRARGEAPFYVERLR